MKIKDRRINEIVAFIAGFAVLVIEILGVHLLAPWFGASTIIWSQQIGLILLAMALGGWAGGALSKRETGLRKYVKNILIVSGLFAGFLSVGLSVFAAWIVPEELTLDMAAGVFQIGSLVSSALFFMPPVFALAMLSPLLVELEVRGGATPGESAGRLGAIGTLGSLIGVMFATYLAIPFFGVDKTLIALGFLLLLFSYPLIAASFSLCYWIPFSVLMPALKEPNMPKDGYLISSLESPYQKIRVVEFPKEGGVRWLQTNEGLDSYQSVWNPNSDWPGGYYDLFSLLPVYANHGLSTIGLKSNYGILGYGGGSAVYPLSKTIKGDDWSIIGVELDSSVVTTSERLLPVSPENKSKVKVYTEIDARSSLPFLPDGMDGFIVDTYARQFELPLHLSTVEFFNDVFQKLKVGGALCFNIGSSAKGIESSVLSNVAKTVIEVFGEDQVRLHRVPRSRNWVLVARREMALPSLQDLAETMPAGLPIEVGAACLPYEVVEGKDLLVEGSQLLTDLKNPLNINQLQEWREGIWH